MVGHGLQVEILVGLTVTVVVFVVTDFIRALVFAAAQAHGTDDFGFRCAFHLASVPLAHPKTRTCVPNGNTLAVFAMTTLS
jgi:hypothetical protein